MSASPRILYYAFGGGLGHACRTLALARQLIRRDIGRHLVLLNTCYPSTLDDEICGLDRLRLAALPHDSPQSLAVRFVSESIDQFRPDVLIVDTFPRGLVGELVYIFRATSIPFRVLIGRQLPQQYVDSCDLKSFVRRNYDHVLVPGENSPFESLPNARRFAPFLIRDGDELLSSEDGRRMLNVFDSRRIVLLVGSGTLDECGTMAALAESLQARATGSPLAIRVALPREAIRKGIERRPGIVRRFPLLDCFPAVRLIVGQAGYNLVHETRAVNVPALLIARPRKYDRQRGRPHAFADVPSVETLWRRIESELQTPAFLTRAYANGAADASRYLQRWID